LAYRDVRENLKLAKKRQRQNYDRKMRHTSFKEGDLVLLRYHHKKPGEVSKFHQPWKGPYKITGKLSEVNYRIVAEEGKNRHPKVFEQFEEN
jgi:hypothetical protein